MYTELLKSNLGRLRIIGFLEGISFLVLLGIAMPLKYMLGQPEAVRHVGMAHGLLFVLYVILVTLVMLDEKWSFKTTAIALLASLIPFGTFYVDARYLRK
jgi:integral membrane protein